MRKYKVEVLSFYSKIGGGKNHIVETSSEEVQKKLDEYTADGWSLASTDASNFGHALYIYLYFEKDSMIEVSMLE